MNFNAEVQRYFTFPMRLIGIGSLVGVFGCLGLAQTAESILLFIFSMSLSFLGTIVTLCGLMVLEENPPSQKKFRKLKSETIKTIKIQYPNYIMKLETLKQDYQKLYGKLSDTREYYDISRKELRNLRLELKKIQKELHDKSNITSQIIDNVAPNGIAEKIIWSEKQVKLTEFSEQLDALSQVFTFSHLEQYRNKLSQFDSSLKRLDHGIRYYRELLIHCNDNDDSKYDTVFDIKQKVDTYEKLMIREEKQMEELLVSMENKRDEAKNELTFFMSQLDRFNEGYY